MRPRTRARSAATFTVALALAPALGLARLAVPAARADSVFIGQRELHGEIAEETTANVVLRTGSGRITIPRKEITKIVHEEEAETLLHEGRALARNRDRKALELFDRAVVAFRKRGDADGAAVAAKERVKLASRLDRETTPLVPAGDDGALSADGSLFLLQKDKEDVQIFVQAHSEGDKSAGSRGGSKLEELALKHLSEFEPRWAVGCFALARDLDETKAKYFFECEAAARLRACGAAVRARDARLALAAIAPVVKERPKDPHVAYLEGRALEIAARPAEAARSYRRALDGVEIPGLADLPNDLLCVFARMRITGSPPREGSPGFGTSWTRVESDHFVVYHQLGDMFRDDEVRFFESSRDRALVRLELAEADVATMGRLPLFLFKDKAAYTQGGGDTWAGGHAQSGELEDGLYHLVCTFPGRRTTDSAVIPHELAHVFVREAFPDLVLPVWANEGVAMYCEPEDYRDQRRTTAARLFDLGRWRPVGELLARATLDRSDDATISAFYTESCVVFETLVEMTGGVKPALRLASRMARKGVEQALKELGLSTDAIDAKVRAKLGH